MYRALTLATAIVLGTLLAARVWAQPPWAQPQGKPNGSFEGYWMGVNPVDGGDARRSLVRKSDGTYMLAARDSVLTLCDSTEHGFASFDDGTVIARNTMQSNTLTIRCFNNGATVVLHARYELVKNGLMLEFAAREDGTAVSTIVLHKVSAD